MKRLFQSLLVLVIVFMITLGGDPVRADQDLPPWLNPIMDFEQVSSTSVYVAVPVVVSGMSVQQGGALGTLLGGDVGLPAWGQGESAFYPHTICIKDALSIFTRWSAVDSSGDIMLPGTLLGDLLTHGTGVQEVCVLNPLTGGVIPVDSRTPIPVERVPVMAVRGNIPVPGSILTEDYGRHIAYFSGNTFHSGIDLVGSQTIEAGGYTFPRQSIVTALPCEPVWVRGGVVTCATPAPLGWNGVFPDKSTWGEYWGNSPSGLTVLTTYLHVDTYVDSLVTSWGDYANYLQSTSSGEPDLFSNNALLNTLVPEQGTIMTVYCAAPTLDSCGTTASHLHLTFSVIPNNEIYSSLRAPGVSRIQPNNTNRWVDNEVIGNWWRTVFQPSTTPIAVWKSTSETNSIPVTIRNCFGSTLESASLEYFRNELQTLSPDGIPTPHTLMTDPVYEGIVRDWMAWTNSFAPSTQFGQNSPVAVMACLANTSLTMPVRDQSYPGGYPGDSRFYSSSCAGYPLYPSYKCNVHEYIPGHSSNTDLQRDQYWQVSAQSLFFNVWYQVYGSTPD